MARRQQYDPSGLANWASYKAVFDEYRVLGIEYEFVPYQFNGELVIQSSVAAVIDYDDSTMLTSYTLATRYPSCVEVPGGRTLKILQIMSGAENAQFISTNATAATAWIKSYSSGNTVSTTIGRLRVFFVIQFRGPGI